MPEQPVLICQCGCGAEIPWLPHYSYKPARFLPGHQNHGKSRTIVPPADWIAPSGLCECGCGEATTVAVQTSLKRSEYRGYPRHYILGHGFRGKRGALASRWKGGRIQTDLGYWLVWAPDHPNANKNGYVLEHRLVWEQHHGQTLNRDQHVHHIDGDPSNNDIANLQMLPGRQHYALHGKSPITSGRKSAANVIRYSDPAERERQRERQQLWWSKHKSTESLP